MYYPFGLTVPENAYTNLLETENKYLYNGKELQNDLDLNWYDYGARMYMPDIGRWGVVDAAIEKHFEWTPYAYVYNNPIQFIDPLGLDSAQRAEAINQMNQHVEQNTAYRGDVSYSSLPCGNDPGVPGNCSSTVSNDVVAGGEPNPSGSPSSGDKGSGVLNIEANTVKVKENKDIQAGNIITFRIEEPKYPYHVGLITGVSTFSNGKITITFGHNQTETGAVSNSFTIGDGSTWDQRFHSAYKWDTKPDQPVNATTSSNNQTSLSSLRSGVPVFSSVSVSSARNKSMRLTSSPSAELLSCCPIPTASMVTPFCNTISSFVQIPSISSTSNLFPLESGRKSPKSSIITALPSTCLSHRIFF